MNDKTLAIPDFLRNQDNLAVEKYEARLNALLAMTVAGKYEESLAEVETLIAIDPSKDSDEGQRLNKLADIIEEYEKFLSWMRELNKLFDDDMAEQCGYECWLEMFCDGLTPGEAYHEEITSG